MHRGTAGRPDGVRPNWIYRHRGLSVFLGVVIVLALVGATVAVFRPGSSGPTYAQGASFGKTHYRAYENSDTGSNGAYCKDADPTSNAANTDQEQQTGTHTVWSPETGYYQVPTYTWTGTSWFQGCEQALTAAQNASFGG